MDDKKKTLAVGVLFVAMLAIGAFQFTRGGDDQAAKPKDAGATGTTTAKSKAVASKTGQVDLPPTTPLPALAERDPFHPVSLPDRDPSTVAPKPPVVKASPTPPSVGRTLPPLKGSLIPIDSSALPPGRGPSGPIGPGQQMPPVFAYHLKGIITGARPVAVFADAQGNERLVPQGGSLDGDSQVVSVGRGGVTVRTHGKTTTYTPGGNDSGN